ncbi:hypothetical protein, partial [Nonomuraea sp. MG754425]|uniref:hypothetical protein n=1 Tax=Nonomuraea sp. MG754425 TaxID=2570319 RepID=UPI001F388DB0
PQPRPAARRSANRAFLEVGAPLAVLAAAAMTAPDTADALRTLRALYDTRAGTSADAALADDLGSAAAQSELLTALRRLPADRIERACLNALPAVGLAALWRATGVRPLEHALTTLPPAQLGATDQHLRPSDTGQHLPPPNAGQPLLPPNPGQHLPPPDAGEHPAGPDAEEHPRAADHDQRSRPADAVRPPGRAEAGGRPQLGLLLLDAPLPGSLRGLARHEAIAPARSMELVARRVRAAVGRLARAADPLFARHVARHADTAALCALVVAVTTWPPDPALPTVAVSEPGRTSVPGFPRTDLEDPSGPWPRAFPGAVELGADLDVFWERVADGGLRVPVTWLGHGGWPALWQRAARRRPAAP